MWHLPFYVFLGQIQTWCYLEQLYWLQQGFTQWWDAENGPTNTIFKIINGLFWKIKKLRKRKKRGKPQLYCKQCPSNPTTADQAGCNYGRWQGQKGMPPFLSLAFFPKWRKLLLLLVCFETDRKCWVKWLKTELLEISVRWVLEGSSHHTHSHP